MARGVLGLHERLVFFIAEHLELEGLILSSSEMTVRLLLRIPSRTDGTHCIVLKTTAISSSSGDVERVRWRLRCGARLLAYPVG